MKKEDLEVAKKTRTKALQRSKKEAPRKKAIKRVRVRNAGKD